MILKISIIRLKYPSSNNQKKKVSEKKEEGGEEEEREVFCDFVKKLNVKML